MNTLTVGIEAIGACAMKEPDITALRPNFAATAGMNKPGWSSAFKEPACFVQGQVVLSGKSSDGMAAAENAALAAFAFGDKVLA